MKWLAVLVGVGAQACTKEPSPSPASARTRPALAPPAPLSGEPAPSAEAGGAPSASPSAAPSEKPGELESARVAMAAVGARDIESAVLQWQVSRGSTCPSVDDLVRERFILPSRATDPWGEKYNVSCTGDGAAAVTSAGPDKQRGTADDVGTARRH